MIKNQQRKVDFTEKMFCTKFFISTKEEYAPLYWREIGMNQVGDSLKEGAMLGRRAMKPGQKREQWAVELTKTKKEIQMETRGLSGHSCKKQGQARGEGFLAEKR